MRGRRHPLQDVRALAPDLEEAVPPAVTSATYPVWLSMWLARK